MPAVNQQHETSQTPPSQARRSETLPSGPLPAGFRIAQVVDRRTLAHDIEQFRLRLTEPVSEPIAVGSHLELLLPLDAERPSDSATPGVETPAPEVRHYSITQHDAADFSIAVLREPEGRGGSRWMHEHAHPGAELAVRGPRNTFPFEAGESVLFVAGGIGVTPFLTMISEAERAGSDWRLLYLGRSLQGMAFAEQLAGHGERVTVWPSGLHGRYDLRRMFAELPWKTRVYACGPDALQRELRLQSAATGHVVVIEDFDAGKANDAGTGGAGVVAGAGVGAEGSAASAAGADPVGPAANNANEPFVVELADGTEVDVPADKSILESLNDAGFRVLSSCRRGTCGTCETPIIEGEAEHRDSVLSEEERAANECMMICVSRARGERIVIDL